MTTARKPFGVITRKAVARILGTADSLPERSKASKVLTTVACRLQLFVYELERARFEHRTLVVEQLLDRLHEHCQLLNVASVQGGGVQSGYALLSELSDLLKELEASVLLLPRQLGSDARYKPALDELQSLLANVSQYRQECEDTKRHLEAALSELARGCASHLARADGLPVVVSSPSELPPTSSAIATAAGRAAPATELGVGCSGSIHSARGNNISSLAVATDVDADAATLDGAAPGDIAVLQRVRQVICSLELDVEMGERDQDLDTELLQLRGHLQQELLQQQQHKAEQQQQQHLDLDGLDPQPHEARQGAGVTSGARRRREDRSNIPNSPSAADTAANDAARPAPTSPSASSLSWYSLSRSGSWSADLAPYGIATATHAARPSRLHVARHVSRRLAAQHLALLKEQQRQLRLQQAAAEAPVTQMTLGDTGHSGGGDADADAPPAARRRRVDGQSDAGSEASDSTGTGVTVVVAFENQIPSSSLVSLAAGEDVLSATGWRGHAQAPRDGADGESEDVLLEATWSAAGRAVESSIAPGEYNRSDPRVHAADGAAAVEDLAAELPEADAKPAGRVGSWLPVRFPAMSGAGAGAMAEAAMAPPSPPLPPPQQRPTEASVAALRKLNRVTTLAGMWEAGRPVAAEHDVMATAPSSGGGGGSSADSTSDCEDGNASDVSGDNGGEMPARPAVRRPSVVLPSVKEAAGPGQVPRVASISHSPFHALAMRGRAPKAPPPPVLCRLLTPPTLVSEPILEETPASPAPPRGGGWGGDAGNSSPVQSPTAAAAAVAITAAAVAPGFGLRVRGGGPLGPAAAAPAPLPLPDASVHLRAVGLPGCFAPNWAPPGPLGLPGGALHAGVGVWLQLATAAGDAGGVEGGEGSSGNVNGGGGGDGGGGGGGAELLYLGPDVPMVDLHRDISGWGPCLGRGAFGAVYKALFRSKPAAVKVLHSGALDVRDLRSLSTEISLLCRLRHHPNIITVYGAAAAPPDCVALVTELMDCDLYDYIHRRRQNCVPPDEVLTIARAIAAGLSELHPAIVHRDLKPANVLLRHSAPPPNQHQHHQHHQPALDRKLTVKIADFGLARHKRSQYLSTRERDAGTLKYMAPECIANGGGNASGNDGGDGEGGGSGITEKCDIYSFGVLLYELITGREPWEGCHPLYAMCQVQSGATLQLPDDPSRCPPALRSLVLRCWAYQHHQRPSSRELLQELDALIAGQQQQQQQHQRLGMEGLAGGGGGGGGGGTAMAAEAHIAPLPWQ